MVAVIAVAPVGVAVGSGGGGAADFIAVIAAVVRSVAAQRKRHTARVQSAAYQLVALTLHRVPTQRLVLNVPPFLPQLTLQLFMLKLKFAKQMKLEDGTTLLKLVIQ